MTISIAIIIFFGVGVGFLTFYVVKKGILAGKTAETYNQLEKNHVLEAIKAGKAAVEKDPKDAEAHYYLGKAFLADERNEQALREFKSVSRLGIEGKNIPEAEFRETIARLYVEFKEPEEALKEYVLLIKLRPEFAEYYFQAGRIFNERNRGDLAVNYIKKAISLDLKEVKYYVELGVILYQNKNFREADGTLDAALNMDPDNPKIHFYKGKILKDNKDFKGALPFFQKASEDQEFKLSALIEAGTCYMSLKMIDKATAELERAVKVAEEGEEADSLYARYFLGICYEKNQEFAKAVAQWEKIYDKKKNFRDVGEKLTQYEEYRKSEQT